MNRFAMLTVFAQIANGAFKAIETRVLEQPVDARVGFEFWCYRTQFARIVEVAVETLK